MNTPVRPGKLSGEHRFRRAWLVPTVIGFGRARILATLGAILVVALAFSHALVQQDDLGLMGVWNAVFAFEPDNPAQTLARYLRLPRTASALIAGGALAVAGALFQALTRNPLVSPGILGVTAGAHLGLAVMLGFAPIWASTWPPMTVAFAGGALAGLLTWIVAGGVAAPPVRLALSGVAVSLMLNAASMAIAIFQEDRSSGLFLWGGGSLVQTDWDGPRAAGQWLLVSVLPVLVLARPLDILLLGDDRARALGQCVGCVRAAGLATATVLTAAAVVLAGPVAFVGLVAPNLVRLAGVTSHLKLIPLAALWGAAILLGADHVVLLFAGEGVELPLGVPTALIGAPVLVLLARRLGVEHGPAGNPEGLTGTSRRPVSQAVTLVPIAMLMALACFAGVSGGASWLSPDLVITGLKDAVLLSLNGVQPAPDPEASSALALRLPRVSAALIGGAMLGASGLLLQGTLRNPLAGPELMGITQSAGLAAVAVLVLMPHSDQVTVQMAAVAGGVAAAAAVLGLTAGRLLSTTAVALMALGIAFFASAATAGLVVAARFQAASAVTWLSGSTYGVTSAHAVGLAMLALVLLPLAWVTSRWADLLGLGPDKARSLGVPVANAERSLIFLGAALAAAAAAVFGPVAFVGLMAPHIARLLGFGKHRSMLFATAGIGALILVVADLVGRAVLPPTELPVGLVTALIGGPYILMAMRRAQAA